MVNVEYYSKRIKECRIMFDVCLHYLKFAHGEARKKDKLRGLKIEVAEKNNFNRIKSAERVVKDATYNEYELWDVTKVLAKILGVSEYSDAVREYHTYISEMKTMGPQKYLVECLEKIEFHKQCLKDDQEREKERQKRERERENSSSTYSASHRSSNSPTYVSKIDDYTGSRVSSSVGKTTTRIDKKKPKAIEKTADTVKSTSEIKKRVVEAEWIEDSDVIAIEKQYELGSLEHSYGFVSRNTIKDLITVNDANVGLSNKYRVNAYNIAKAFNSLFELAVKELKSGDNLTSETSYKMRRVISNFCGNNFVDAYADMYEKLYNYMQGLPEKARTEFIDEFNRSLAVDLKTGGSVLTPEDFRQKVNREIKPEIMSNAILNGDNYQYLAHKTKYMNAEEIGHLYYEMYQHTNQYGSFDCSKIKEVCIELIARKMPHLDEKDPDYKKKLEERIEAIKKDYFHERNDAKEGSAKQVIEKTELITAKKKEYFRMSKLKQALQLMNYQKLIRLSKKEKLSEDEKESIRGMF